MGITCFTGTGYPGTCDCYSALFCDNIIVDGITILTTVIRGLGRKQ